MEQSLTIALGADHAGYSYKESLKEHFLEIGHPVLDMGTHSLESVDYPDFVHPVAKAIQEGKANYGILCCGSANGVAITANKHPQIRAAICWENDLAALSRQHNNANVICLPCRFVELEAALEMVQIFLKTKFEGGRHERRVNKIVPSC